MAGLGSMVLWLALHVASSKEVQWSRLDPTTYSNATECNAALRRVRALIGEPHTTDAASATLLCLPENMDPAKLPQDLFLPR
jgi:hypothetical protein